MRSMPTRRVRGTVAVAVALTTLFTPHAFAAGPADTSAPTVASIERLDPDPTGPAPSAAGLQFGYSVAAADLDADGDAEILTCRCASGGGVVEILGLGAEPVVIGEGVGGFTGDLDRYDWFGDSVEAIGDLNGDGTIDLAVGAPFDDDGGFNRGAVWILFLDGAGSVSGHTKISSIEGGIAPLANNARLGTGIASLGDVDGDGTVDLAVGAANDLVNGVESGTVRIWLMNTDGTVRSEATISQLDLTADEATSREFFGIDVAPAGDVDGDGVVDVAIGASWDNSSGHRSGAIFVATLDVSGVATGAIKISSNAPGAELGAGLASVTQAGAVVTLVASQPGTDSPSIAHVDLESISPDSPVVVEQLTHADLDAYADASLGSGLAAVVTADGSRSILAGAPLADGTRADDGALLVLHLDPATPAPSDSDPHDCDPPVGLVEPLPEPTEPPVEPSEPPAAPETTLPPAPQVTIPGIPVVAFGHVCEDLPAREPIGEQPPLVPDAPEADQPDDGVVAVPPSENEAPPPGSVEAQEPTIEDVPTG